MRLDMVAVFCYLFFGAPLKRNQVKIKRVLANAFIRSIIPATIGFVVWFGGYYLFFNSSGSSKVYKNYTEKLFIEEAIRDRQFSDKISIQSQIVENQKPTTGDFVIIPINGAIADGDSYQNLFDQLFIAAQKNFSTKAVIFYIDSPGGEVTACDKLFNEVLKLKTYGIKTVAFVNSMSASGAYYITANSDKIVASPTSIVGSIGVIMELYNFEGLAGKIGLKIETIKSSEMKDIGSPFRKMSERERRVLQRIVDTLYGRFVAIVRAGRKLGSSEMDVLATGEVWTAQDAKLLGLVDEVGYIKKAIEVAKELTGVTNPRLVIYQKEIGFFDAFIESVSRVNSGKAEKIVENALPPPGFLYQWIP